VTRRKPQQNAIFSMIRRIEMKSLGLLAAAMLVATALPVQASETLAEDNNCLGCHSVEEKLIGPAFKDVAAKYKGQKDAAAMLADKVRKGGSGVWGPVKMPANPKISDKDLKAIIAWVLAQQ
jgi:cytochrome c